MGPAAGSSRSWGQSHRSCRNCPLPSSAAARTLCATCGWEPKV